MGRTLPTFRFALEKELHLWDNFRRGMRLEKQKYLDDIFRFARLYSDTSSLVSPIIISEGIFLPALIEQQKMIFELTERIKKLERKENNGKK